MSIELSKMIRKENDLFVQAMKNIANKQQFRDSSTVDRSYSIKYDPKWRQKLIDEANLLR